MTSPQSTPEYTIPLATAEKVGAVVLDVFRSTCTQRLVAGSVGRRRERCRDLDVVLCPRYQTDLYGRPDGWSPAFLACVRDCPRWTVETKSFGPSSKQITVRSKADPRLKIELWLAYPWSVGWIYLLRTGPSDFTHELVALVGEGKLTSAPGHFYKFEGGMLTCAGQPVRTPDEETVFAELGLPFLAVEDRTPQTLHHLAQEQAAGRRVSA
jgi:DNA polymerase/3'-5' exonuclease PolX